MNRLEKEFTPALRERLFKIINEKGYGELIFTLKPRERQIELLEKYPDEIMAWRDFMQEVYAYDEKEHEDENGDIDYSWEETDFRSMCIGFLIAKGVDSFDAHLLSSFLRYNLQDFDPSLKKTPTKVTT
jgi:hypothetical protein